jgi:NitT/TauT family transport system substrate-binding protein
MAKLKIQPHGRLQEWVADEKGYFRDEGLDYEIEMRQARGDSAQPAAVAADGALPDVMSGAFESYEAGKGHKGEGAGDISCACHWTVNQAAKVEHGKIWGNAYSVADAAILVAPESDIMKPEDLAGKEVAVGYHSGSHYSALQALEVFLPIDSINLKFVGLPWARVDAALERKIAAVNVWGTQRYVLEQQGFRKIADTAFMITFMYPPDADEDQIERYVRALRRAQMDIDLEPERYKHYFLNEMPERFRDMVDVRRFGPGERVVFLPYSQEMFERTQTWMHDRKLFDVGREVGVAYEVAVHR